jgi:hypothetical protein
VPILDGTDNMVQTVQKVPPHIADEFLAIYRSAFGPLDRLAPARQSLTDDEFMSEMKDERVLKFVGSDRQGETVALGSMATDLAAVPWISPSYYREQFPDYFERGAIYYFGSLLVRPDRQGGPWATVLLTEMSKRVLTDGAIAAFDCCAYNVTVLRLPELIETVGRRLGRVETMELDSQQYFAYVFSTL